MSVGILGSGFGLYGYLPALTRMGVSVILPERYRDRLKARPDVAALEKAVEWVRDDEAVLAAADALIVSQRPADQVARVRHALQARKVGRFLLEKPLAPGPVQALELLDEVADAGRTLRVGFTFRYTAWGHALADWLERSGDTDTLTIEWCFQAHHYANAVDTWKRRTSQGGGALRFYGIHLLALLAEHGYRDAGLSRVWGGEDDDAEGWQAVLTGPGRPPCSLRIDSNAAAPAVFAVTGSGTPGLLRRLRDPFDETPVHEGFDRRVDLLLRLCQSLLEDPVRIQPWCRSSVALWQAVEDRTTRDVAPCAGAPAPSLSA